MAECDWDAGRMHRNRQESYCQRSELLKFSVPNGADCAEIDLGSPILCSSSMYFSCCSYLGAFFRLREIHGPGFDCTYHLVVLISMNASLQEKRVHPCSLKNWIYSFSSSSVQHKFSAKQDIHKNLFVSWLIIFLFNAITSFFTGFLQK